IRDGEETRSHQEDRRFEARYRLRLADPLLRFATVSAHQRPPHQVRSRRRGPRDRRRSDAVHAGLPAHAAGREESMKQVAPKATKKASAKPCGPQPPPLGPRLQRAFRYAAAKHDGQSRKATAVPYLSHLMAVASLVLEAGGDEDMAIAALLHDVVEDCGGMPRLREVRKMFGSRVAKIVEGCTDSFGEPKPEWVERKKGYLHEV